MYVEWIRNTPEVETCACPVAWFPTCDTCIEQLKRSRSPGAVCLHDSACKTISDLQPGCCRRLCTEIPTDYTYGCVQLVEFSSKARVRYFADGNVDKIKTEFNWIATPSPNYIGKPGWVRTMKPMAYRVSCYTHSSHLNIPISFKIVIYLILEHNIIYASN